MRLLITQKQLRWFFPLAACALISLNDQVVAQQGESASNKKVTSKPIPKRKEFKNVTSLLRISPKKENADVQMNFAVGRSFFINPWVIPPSSTTARDGLGPLFNARTCQQCHLGGGRGRAPEENEFMRHMLVRLSIPGTNSKKGVVLEPNYGNQFQLFGMQRGSNGYRSHTNEGLQGKVVGEANVSATYQVTTGQFPDGETYTLKKPDFHISDLSYGPLSKKVLLSPRIGPSLHGMGLIDAINQNDILALADPEDKNKDDISGRPNYVWNREENKTMLGRFGLKANTPSLRQQVADAFVNDLGITSSIFPSENCTAKQAACLKAENGRGPHTPHEISDELFDKVVTFVSQINIPDSFYFNKTIKEKQATNTQKRIQQGEQDFLAIGCATCHHPSYVTSESATFKSFRSKEITPYSDFLLHDMGKDLADNRPDFEASGSEWRTAPLWGIKWRQTQGKFNNYLHDGRAATLKEAILWHGGEAESVKQKFMHLPKDRRESVLEFIKSL